MDSEEIFGILRDMNSLEGEWHNLRNFIMNEKYHLFLESGTKFGISASDLSQSDLQCLIQKLMITNHHIDKVGHIPCTNTISICLLLVIQAENLKQEGIRLFLENSKYLFKHAAQSQLIFVSKEASILSEFVVKISSSLNQCSSVINALVSAASLLSVDGSHLTAIHGHILQCCLASWQIKFAVNFINKQMGLRLNPNIHINTPDCLCYYYYSSLVYLAVEDFSKAFYFLNEAISVPSQFLSTIIMSSVKKVGII